MPRLEEKMELTKDKIFMNLEIKDLIIDKVFLEIVKLIENMITFDQISLSSIYHNYSLKVKEYNKNQ